jgi:hypothetical protein
MSWSFCAIGKPEALKAEMARQIETYGAKPEQPKDNLSRWEFEHAAEAIARLLDFADRQTLVRVNANGHGSLDYSTNVFTPNHLACEITPLGVLVEA